MELVLEEPWFSRLCGHYFRLCCGFADVAKEFNFFWNFDCSQVGNEGPEELTVDVEAFD